MAPGLVGPEKAKRGKTPTDTWWNTIVSPTGKEKTGYPTQKPLAILERIVRVHSKPGDRVLDFFAGSGTTGEAAAKLGRSAVLVDSKRAAVEVMARRLAAYEPRCVGFEPRARRTRGGRAAKDEAVERASLDADKAERAPKERVTLELAPKRPATPRRAAALRPRKNGATPARSKAAPASRRSTGAAAGTASGV